MAESSSDTGSDEDSVTILSCEVWLGGGVEGLSVFVRGEVHSWGLFDDCESQEKLEGVF